MAEAATTFSSLRDQLSKGKLAPVYLLHGEEGYYIDRLVKMFESLIPEADRDFNLYTLYAPETSPAQVMDTCRRYPMMADRQVVILKEVQAMPATYLSALLPYIENPSSTSVLAICCRGAQAKGKELFSKIAASGGVVFESKKLTDRTIGPAISEFIKEKKLSIEPKALAMLRDYVGSDLSRIYNEVDKLTVTLGPGAMITPESIERNIGVSKDYNNFELIAAVSQHNEAKAFKIIDYFRHNPKNNPTIVTGTVLFNFFSNLLLCLYTPDKSDSALCAALGFRSPYQLIDLRAALRWYNAWHVIEIIATIRRFDAQSKGVGSRQDSYDLLHDLIFHIFHPVGKV